MYFADTWNVMVSRGNRSIERCETYVNIHRTAHNEADKGNTVGHHLDRLASALYGAGRQRLLIAFVA